jgi:GNAT superfamily N-acetyltransferase
MSTSEFPPKPLVVFHRNPDGTVVQKWLGDPKDRPIYLKPGLSDESGIWLTEENPIEVKELTFKVKEFDNVTRIYVHYRNRVIADASIEHKNSIDTIHVDEDFRSQGVGRKLIEHIIQYIKEHSDKAYLTVQSFDHGPDNTVLIKIYEGLGFKVHRYDENDRARMILDFKSEKNPRADSEHALQSLYAQGMKIFNDVYDSHGGEVFGSIYAGKYFGERLIAVAKIDYSIFENEIHIKVIEVSENNRRLGLATLMVEKLKSEYPDMRINWGMEASEEGTAFVKKMTDKEYLALPDTIVPQVEDAVEQNPMTPEAPKKYYLRCEDCLAVTVVIEDRTPKSLKCGACGGPIEVMGFVKREHLFKTELEVPCDVRCTNAKGPNCDCMCHGENHGSQLLVKVDRQVGKEPTVTPVDKESTIKRAEEYRALKTKAQDIIEKKYGAVMKKKYAGEYISDELYWGHENAIKDIRRAKKARTHAGRIKILNSLIEELNKPVPFKNPAGEYECVGCGKIIKNEDEVRQCEKCDDVYCSNCFEETDPLCPVCYAKAHPEDEDAEENPRNPPCPKCGHDTWLNIDGEYECIMDNCSYKFKKKTDIGSQDPLNKDPFENPEIPEYPTDCLRRLFERENIIECYHNAAGGTYTTRFGIQNKNTLRYMLKEVRRMIENKEHPSKISSFIAKTILSRDRIFKDGSRRTTWFIIFSIYDCFDFKLIMNYDERSKFLDNIRNMSRKDIEDWLNSHFPEFSSGLKSGNQSRLANLNASRFFLDQTLNSSSVMDDDMPSPSINNLLDRAETGINMNPRVLQKMPKPKVIQEKVEQAKQEVETFKDAPVQGQKVVRIPVFSQSWKKLCSFLTNLYSSNKWTGENKLYYHPFKDGIGRDVCITKDGRYIVAFGPCVNTKDGIDDKSSATNVKHGDNAREFLSKIKVWAKLADCIQVDLPCADCDGVLRFVVRSDDDKEWICDKCGGHNPKYDVEKGKMYFNDDWILCIMKIKK